MEAKSEDKKSFDGSNNDQTFEKRMSLVDEKDQLAKFNFNFPFDLNNLFSL